MRFSYWHSTEWIKNIRTKYELTNPLALSMEGWDEWEQECKRKSPIIHWLTRDGIDKLQDIVYWPKDKYNVVRYATIWRFLKNIWLFRECLWNYRNWDYSGMLRFMETASNDMVNSHEKSSRLLNSDNVVKELKIFSELLKRVREDNYMDNKEEFVHKEGRGWMNGEFVQKSNTLPSIRAKSFYKLQRAQQTNDLKLAAKIFERHVRSWWH